MFSLRDYQITLSDQCLEKLQQYKIVCLAAETRTGKTLTSLETARKYGAEKVLFVTKLKAISSIEGDFKLLNPGYSLTTINYESLHNALDEFDFIIVDECHKCGAFPIPSKCVKELRKIIKDKPCILMSGTFTAESYSQIYHILSVSNNTPFKEYKSFYSWANSGFVNKKVKYIYNRQLTDYKDAVKIKVDEFTNHLFISFSQKSAGFQQEIKEVIEYVKMKPGTYFLAERLRTRRVFIGKDGQEIVADTEVKLLQKTWQIYSGSVLAEDRKAICFDHSKAEFIRDKYGKHKIAIFYIFKAEYAMILWAFGYDRLTDDPEVFNSSTDKIFVSQIQSGSMGVNLSTADYLIMYNIHYSNVLYWQSRDRIQSQKRDKPAVVVWVFSEKGIEDNILRTVRDKQSYVLSYFRKDFNIKKELV